MIHAITATRAFDESKKHEARENLSQHCSGSQPVSEETSSEATAADCENGEAEILMMSRRQIGTNLKAEENEPPSEKLNGARRVGRGLW